jgi:ubiquitin-protein ligase
MGKKHDSPRLRRLRADRKAMEALDGESNVLEFEAFGDPPGRYVVTLHGPGTVRDDGGAVRTEATHQLEILLGADYPRRKPLIRWLTPIFHPNISTAGAVCLGGYTSNWVPSIGLADLCEMLWDMLRYANFDVTNPFHREAADWAREQTAFPLPLDDRPLRDRLARTRRSAGAGGGGEERAAAKPDILYIGPDDDSD